MDTYACMCAQPRAHLQPPLHPLGASLEGPLPDQGLAPSLGSTWPGRAGDPASLPASPRPPPGSDGGRSAAPTDTRPAVQARPPRHGAPLSLPPWVGAARRPPASLARPGPRWAPARDPAPTLSGCPGLGGQSQVRAPEHWPSAGRRGAACPKTPGRGPPAWPRPSHYRQPHGAETLAASPREAAVLTCTVLLYRDAPLYDTPLNGVHFLIIYKDKYI